MKFPVKAIFVDSIRRVDTHNPVILLRKYTIKLEMLSCNFGIYTKV